MRSNRALDVRYLFLLFPWDIRVDWGIKIARTMVHRPSVLDHLQRGEARHLEAPAVRGLSEGARRM